MIDKTLASRLVAAQFPHWKNLLIKPVARSGWDNRTFHLGDNMLIRMPSAAEYALSVEKEQIWLPKLAPLLPLTIPTPLALGNPTAEYPWKWSIYKWIEGEVAASVHITNLCDFAISLAHFLKALQKIDSTDGPLAGPHSFFRGGSLAHYNEEVLRSFTVLQDKIDIDAARKLWQEALTTKWEKKPVWVHGDVSAGNLLLQNGRLSAVIDFGQLSVGDPACDLAIGWTLFNNESRDVFRTSLQLDNATWMRGRAWTLWKALVVAANFTNPHNSESNKCWQILEEVLTDYKNS